MSKDSSDTITARPSSVPWNGWFGAVSALVIFFGAQIVAGLTLFIYPAIRGWSEAQARDWLANNLSAQLIYLAAANIFIFAALWLFLKRYNQNFKILGLVKPKAIDPLYSLLALPVYFVILALSVMIIKYFVPALNLDQVQDLGFNGTYSGVQLFFIAVSLVILPPITEEVVFRGMIFTSLKKTVSVLWAALITSVFFAAGHLLESGDGALLYIAAIDTFVLSLILVYLRQKTGRLWASIGLHGLKNAIAFVSLFVIHIR